MPTDVPALYAGTRARIVDLVSGLTPEEAARPVVTCPGWSVHDVLAHVTGAASDFITGNLPRTAIDEWTARHVAARKDVPTAAVVDEWLDLAERIDACIGGLPEPLRGITAVDLVSHEHDLRTGLDRPGARDTDAVGFGMRRFAVGLGARLTERGLPALRVAATDTGADYVAGEGEPAATVRASGFELFRALGGRRSRGQVAAYDWAGDAETYLDAFPTFGVHAERDVVE